MSQESIDQTKLADRLRDCRLQCDRLRKERDGQKLRIAGLEAAIAVKQKGLDAIEQLRRALDLAVNACDCYEKMQGGE